MKRILLTAGATLLAAVPVTMGLIGNTSFAQSVPVFVPAHAIVVEDSASQSKKVEHPAKAGDDKGGPAKHTEAGDDKGGVATHTEAGDVKGGLTKHTEAGDDKGGLATHTVQPAQSGDDKGGLAKHAVQPAQSGDNKGGLSKRTAPSDDKVVTSGSGKDATGGHASGGLTGGKSSKDDSSAHS